MRRALALALALLGSCPLVAYADWRLATDGPIVTDRPGNGNAARSVTRGHLNLELGALYAWPQSGVHQLSFPVSLRLGVLERLELRAGSALVGYERTAVSSQVDPADTSVGLKASVLDAGAARPLRPDLAFSADVFLPSGSGAFSAGAAVPELRALLAWALPGDLSLLVNLGGDVPADGAGDRRYGRVLYVLNLGWALPVLAGRMSVFAEVFGRQGRASEDREQIVQLDWGLAALLREDLQLDFFAQHGLTRDAPNLQLSVGCSVRL